MNESTHKRRRAALNGSAPNRTEVTSKVMNTTELISSLRSGPVSGEDLNHAKNGCDSDRIKTPWTIVDSLPGFFYFRKALTPEHQESLVERIDANNGRWDLDFSRWRQWYGYRYGYKNDVLFRDGDGTLPPWILELTQFAYDRKWMSTLAQQVTIQKYIAGSFIGPHVDSSRCFPGEIVTVSLVSTCDFRLMDAGNRTKLTRQLEPGDIVVLKDYARDTCKHEILKCKPGRVAASAHWRRLSITLRNINPLRVQP